MAPRAACLALLLALLLGAPLLLSSPGTQAAERGRGSTGGGAGTAAGTSVVAWGSNSSGQCTVPSPNTGFKAVAAGHSHSLGLKSDGSVVAWGNNTWGQCNPPPPTPGS